jgi:hypothetical protein
MNNLFYITLITCISLVSCQENIKRDAIDKSQNSFKNRIDNEKNIVFNKEELNCLEKDKLLSCSNIEKKVSIIFNEDSFLFKLNNNKYFYPLDSFLSEFGQQTYLFNYDNENIIIIEEHYEEIDFYRFFYTFNNTVYFLGDKEYGNEEKMGDFHIEKKENLIIIKSMGNILQLNLTNKKLLVSSLETTTYPSDLEGSWFANCNWGYGIDFVPGEVGIAKFPIHEYRNIGVEAIVKKTSTPNEYILTFDKSFNYDNRYPLEANDLVDSEISKEEIIAKLYLQDNGDLEFHWIGLYNTKTKKLDVTGNQNLYIDWNKGKNPVMLKTCKK